MADSKWHTLKPTSDLRLLISDLWRFTLGARSLGCSDSCSLVHSPRYLLSRRGTAAAKIPSDRLLDCGLAFHNCGSH